MSTESLQQDERVQRIHQKNKIYFWSLKHQKLIQVTSATFDKNNCELCIPNYHAVKTQRKPCKLNFRDFSAFKKHLLSIEERYKRPLVWSTRDEIPDNLRRERELGHLEMLEDEQIIRIEFNNKTVIKPQAELLEYFRKNGCHCKDGIGPACTTNLGANKYTMFSHLAAIERKFQRFFVFKGTVEENDLKTSTIQSIKTIKSNNVSTPTSAHNSTYEFDSESKHSSTYVSNISKSKLENKSSRSTTKSNHIPTTSDILVKSNESKPCSNNVPALKTNSKKRLTNFSTPGSPVNLDSSTNILALTSNNVLKPRSTLTLNFASSDASSVQQSPKSDDSSFSRSRSSIMTSFDSSTKSFTDESPHTPFANSDPLFDQLLVTATPPNIFRTTENRANSIETNHAASLNPPTTSSRLVQSNEPVVQARGMKRSIFDGKECDEQASGLKRFCAPANDSDPLDRFPVCNSMDYGYGDPIYSLRPYDKFDTLDSAKKILDRIYRS